MPKWDEFMSDKDREIVARAGYGARVGLGDRPALLVIDVTYGFAGDPAQPDDQVMQRWRNACVDGAATAIPATVELLAAARHAGVPTFYTKPPRTRADGRNRGRWLDKNSRGTEDTLPDEMTFDIVKEIAPIDADMVIEKEKPSAFFGTPLVAFLTDLGIDTILVCGVATSGCIRASVIDAFSYNYRVGIVEEATFDRSESSHWINLFDMDQKYADLMPLSEVTAYFDRQVVYMAC
jgi:nicotinamidase-related amidase